MYMLSISKQIYKDYLKTTEKEPLPVNSYHATRIYMFSQFTINLLFGEYLNSKIVFALNMFRAIVLFYQSVLNIFRPTYHEN